ncbi:MAG: FAD-binding oxidoreductase [Gammaproteobacteria bacterium]|nr:FAD-binding oxidoreductase [Gammaproteobacteria bacterium]
MLTRRRFLGALAEVGAGLTLARGALGQAATGDGGVPVNDVHSRLNPTYVREVVLPDGIAGLQQAVIEAVREGRGISIAGGRHAMGGQQFGTGTVLIDTRPLNRVLSLDDERGLVEVEAGIQWPELVAQLTEIQKSLPRHWSIIQKQTGADRLCLGGALASNIHGRGLTRAPIIGDVESFRLIDATGRLLRCSRTENGELFRLVIGGYGLFGVIATVTLRLMPRTKLQRVVEIVDTADLMAAFERRIAEGYLYGDCQFSTDPRSKGFLRKGVFSCYRPVGEAAAAPGEQKQLGERDWRELYYLAHADPAKVYDLYSSYYLSTSGQIYSSDTHQLSTYIDDYHEQVDARMGAPWPGSEMITEVYVPRPALGRLLDQLAADFRRHDAQVIYGTIRLIEKDQESFLPWAREPFVCVVLNLHVDHSPQGIVKAANDFRRIIQRAIEHGGSYFLTYHRWATREQVDACYPQMKRFLDIKRRYDPDEVFQSDWYRHYKRMLA